MVFKIKEHCIKYFEDPYWKDYYHVRCNNNHKIVLPMSRIKKLKENYCYLCTGNINANYRKNIYDYKNRCGTSGKYIGYNEHDDEVPIKTRTNADWFCNTCKNIVQASYLKVGKENWCSNCAKSVKHEKIKLEAYINTAKGRGEFLGEKDENGKFILIKPKNIMTKYWWRCNCGNEFESSYGNVHHSQTWCSLCFKRSKKELKDYINIPQNKGIYLGLKNENNGYDNSIIPENTHSNIAWWKCYTCEYEFNMTYQAVASGHWCHKCGKTLKKELIDYENLLISKGKYMGIKNENGELNNKLIPKNNSDNSAYWYCNACENIFNACYANIREGKWCPKCAKVEKKILTDYQNCCIGRGIYLGIKNDSGEYVLDIPENTTYSNCFWKCKICEYEFHASFQNINKNRWCPSCSNHVRKTIEDYDFVCKSQGYYLGIKNEDGNIIRDIPLTIANKGGIWQCKKDHQFESTYSNIYSGSFCPHCRFKTEQKLYEFITKYFDVKRQYINDFSYNKFTGRHLRYDFYIEDEKYGKIIIELHGDQHFRKVWNWQNHEEVQIIDVAKMVKALDNDIRMIIIYQPNIWDDTINWKKLIKNAIKSKEQVIWIAENETIFDNHKQLLEEINTNEELIEKINNLGK